MVTHPVLQVCDVWKVMQEPGEEFDVVKDYTEVDQ
jgi:hypothetical protein